eukprot:s1206_g19.t1
MFDAYAAYASEPAMMAVQPCLQAATAAWSSRNFVIQKLWCLRCMIFTRGQQVMGGRYHGEMHFQYLINIFPFAVLPIPYF